MKLEKLSAWSEIISSVAILITLIYLAIQTGQNAEQTRQNAEAIKASTRQQMLGTDMAFLRDIFNDPEITTLQYKPDLTDPEKAKVAAQYTMFLRQRENNWIQFQNGALDELTWNSMKSTINVIAHQPNFRIYWGNLTRSGNAMGFAPELTQLVDEIVNNTKAGEKAVFIELMQAPGGNPHETEATSELSWMAGCWQTADGATREIWNAASGTHMFGHSVTIKDGEVSFFENLNVVKAGETYVLSAYPMGQGPSDFSSVARAENSIMFENLAHDYPQRIGYSREGDQLTGTISLADGSKPNEWVYGKCEN
jgi:hypothetical protein